jgi:hypothetical protein
VDSEDPADAAAEDPDPEDRADPAPGDPAAEDPAAEDPAGEDVPAEDPAAEDPEDPADEDPAAEDPADPADEDPAAEDPEDPGPEEPGDPGPEGPADPGAEDPEPGVSLVSKSACIAPRVYADRRTIPRRADWEESHPPDPTGHEAVIDELWRVAHPQGTMSHVVPDRVTSIDRM